VPAADVLHERVTLHDHTSGAVTFEAAHGTKSSLESPMVGFDPVVRALLSVLKRARDQLIDHREERPGPVGHNLRARWLRSQEH
jgi:hypothetical protein